MSLFARPTKETLDYYLFIIPLFILVFLVNVDHLMMVPLSADIAKATGLALEKSGLLVAVYPISSAISAFFLAPFSDRLGRKRMLLFLVLGFSLATLGCALSFSVGSIFLFRILSGVFGGLILPNALAFVGDAFSAEKRMHALATIMLSFSAASILGVPFGAWLGEAFSWQSPFYIIVIGGLICGGMVFYLKAIPTGAEKKSIGKQYMELLQLWTQPKIRRLFLIQFFMFVGLFGCVPHLSVWLTMNYHMSTTQIGLCYMQGGIGALIGNLVARRFLMAGYKAGALSVGSIVMSVALLIFTLEYFSASYVGVFFAGAMFGGSLRMPALQLILTEIVPIHTRGRLMSMSTIVNHVTMGIGGVWSLPLLSIEGGKFHGMFHVGVISFFSLWIVPLLVHTQKDLFTPSAPRSMEP